MNETLPPLVFSPRLVAKLWGGRKLAKVLGKSLPSEGNFGESWEIFDLPPGYVEGSGEWVTAVVADGPVKGKTLHELVTSHPASLMGEVKPLETSAGPQFPLLVKFLDADHDLSIQVHPTPEYAEKNKDAHLKTECWIVMAADKGAKLYKGLKPGVTRDGFEKAIKAGTVAELVETVPAGKGECHFLPSGIVHALGAGVLVAEVQTPSDTTYRVFDFNRSDPATGKPRKLHVEQALECIDFSGTKPPLPTSTRTAGTLVDCEHFKTTTMKASAHQTRPLGRGQMRIWTVLEGAVKLRYSGASQLVKAGMSVLLPAAIPPNTVASFVENITYLETTVPVKS
jgi:mannose-6-phosphate isomerase